MAVVLKKLLYVFLIGWAVYSIAITGYPIAQRQWYATLNLSPSRVQERAGDVFNQGAIKLNKASTERFDNAILLTDDAEGILKSLPVPYWLYPLHISSVYINPDSPSNRVISDKQLKKALANQKINSTIIFVGSNKTLARYQDRLGDYRRATIAEDQNGKLFVLMRKEAP